MTILYEECSIMSFKIKSPAVIFREMKEDFKQVSLAIKAVAIMLIALSALLSIVLVSGIITIIAKSAILFTAVCFLFF